MARQHRTSSIDRRHLLLGAGALATVPLLSGAPTSAQLAPPAIPPAPRDGTVDVLHGVSIPDPFRPLEDAARADVQAWISAMDTAAKTVLKDRPLHGRVMSFLNASGKYQRPFAPRRVGSRLFSLAFDGASEQARLDVTDAPSTTPPAKGAVEPAPRVLLDPGKFSDDGTSALANYFPDRFGNKIAYLITDAGGDASTLRIRDVRTGMDLNDKLEGCRFSSVAWLPDGNSFYYTRGALPTENPTWDRTGHLIFHHQLGYPQAADRMMFNFASRKNVFMWLRPSYSTNQLFIEANVGTSRKNGLWVAPIDNAGLAIRLVQMGRNEFWMVRNVGARIYAITDMDAPKRRLVSMTLGNPGTDGWKTIVPESDGVIDGAAMAGNRLLVRHFKDLAHKLTIYDLEGVKQHDVALGERSQLTFSSGERDVTQIHVSVSTPLQPGRVDKLNLLTGQTELHLASKAKHDLADMTVRTVFATSKDGTKIPVTLLHRPDLKLDGENRTLLYGYGGFGITERPGYRTLAAAWVRLGGVYAVAHIRGGGELGNTWHDGGSLANQQNGFDDFASVAEWLVAEKITTPKRLGIQGASNGGRLVLSSFVQRPELFGAVVCGVPVADMVRFDKHTWGISWKQEYGDVDKPEDFKLLYKLSPVHNIRAKLPNGAAYPPLLILTAENDQRVVPAHAYKFAAALKDAVPTAEVYVRTRRRGGHGNHNAYSLGQEYTADVVTFLTEKLGGPVLDLPKIDA
jgi:prolyl oligopeptidase